MKDFSKKYSKYLLTGVIVIVAIIILLIRYWDYLANPWTRDGRVRAVVIQIAPRVSGPIVQLPIKDNQFVKAGDLLFEIDPRTYEVSLEQARAQLDQTGYNVEALEKQVEQAKAALAMSRTSIQQAQSSIDALDVQVDANQKEYERQKLMLERGATSQRAVDQASTAYENSLQQRKSAVASRTQAEASVQQAQAALDQAQARLGELGENNPQIRAALAAVRQAELNLEFTQVRAPVDGYVTNLVLQTGSQANANQPSLALVDINSFWIHGYFRETVIGNVKPGDRAVVTLMSFPDTPIEGKVESIGWGISQQDGSSGYYMLPTVSPTFEWIRLAQRVPVRIHLTNVPKEIELRVGTTASVLVKTRSGSSKKSTPAPAALQ